MSKVMCLYLFIHTKQNCGESATSIGAHIVYRVISEFYPIKFMKGQTTK